MARTVAYSPRKDDLFFPGKNATFFEGATSISDALLCAGMARLAYCSCEPESFALDRPRISSVLQQVGFFASGFFESQGTHKSKGTHCFVAMRQDKQLAVVAFRGTDKNDPTNVADDADAVPVPWEKAGKVHRGFKTALANVRDDLVSALSSLRAPNLRVFYTGHSLGAALVTLLAGISAPASLYTFGSPLVGDADFVASLAQVDNHRYVNCCDIVTRVPPSKLGYRHLGRPLYITRDGSINFDPAEAFIREDRLSASLAYPVEYQAWKAENVGLRELADHAPINYVNAVKAGVKAAAANA